MRLSLLLPVLAACTGGTNDVTGPFTGATTRFAIDRYDLPLTYDQATTLGDDLDNNRTIDNQIGRLFASLAQDNNLTTYATSMAAVGLLPSTIEIQADSLDDDDSVGVSYIGRPGDTAVPAGGRIVGGNFRSNRTAVTAHPAEGALVLPVFADANPTGFALDRAEIDLTRDATGYTGVIRGAVDSQAALLAASTSVLQMVTSNPHDHPVLGAVFDPNKDGAVTLQEITTSSLMESLLAPDLEGTSVSIGFGFHITACPSGTCEPPTIADACHDRVKDGDETDVDCGGSCRACAFTASCSVASDCETGSCDSGSCRAPTCSDEVIDGFETGVDCGTPHCGSCAGADCGDNGDCHSGRCTLGKCE